jgi:hypothetical protein
MARPKLGDGDTQRLQLKISSDELGPIEDWRFGNRIPSLSEAVRRLCQIGIVAERELQIAHRRAERALKAMLLLLEKPESQFAKAPKGMRGALTAALAEQVEAVRATTATMIAAGIFRKDGDTDEVDELIKKVEVHLSVIKGEKK